MAAGGTINPLRQQMINMMYLVLLALLALNVSADILKAFALVNKGLDKTNVNYEEKNAIAMAEFADLLKVDKSAALKYYNNAVAAHHASDQMFNYLQSIKEAIASRSGGWLPGSGKTAVVEDNDLETSTRYFLNEMHGVKLRDSLDNFVKTMKSFLDDPRAIPLKIDVTDPPAQKDGTKKDWISYYWEGIPSVAAITELTKFQNDIRNAESDVTNDNINKVGQRTFKFGELQPVISSETPVLALGQDYNAKIFLGGISQTYVPKISVNGVPQKVVNGSVEYSEPASGGGTKELNVSITVPNPHNPGHDTTYIAKSAYTVFSGASTVSASKMNMLYIGLDNPIDVSAAGFTPAQTFVKVSGGGSLKELSPGHYTFKPDGSMQDITATCFVRLKDGGVREMGQPQKYRIRKVPKPEILFGTNPGPYPISAGEVSIVKRINAGFGEAFPYQGLNLSVKKYTIRIMPKTGQAYMETVTGNLLSHYALERLKSVHSGDLIIIGNVECQGPSGLMYLNGPTLAVK
jgi:gliding motility-associated protein GldM